jgi:hypothetical protein
MRERWEFGRLAARTARLALLVCLTLAAAGCQAFPGSTAPVIRIGLVAPFEGRHRPVGYDVIYAARLAVREWNGRGGVGGYRVELVAIDDGGDIERAVRAAQSLVIDPQVVGVLGHWLEETTTAASPTYAEAGLALVPTSADAAAATAAAPPPEGFADRYRDVAPLGELPGPYALAAYQVANRLVEAIGESIAAGGKPTRAGVLTALSATEP